jgi:hypothetical protein
MYLNYVNTMQGYELIFSYSIVKEFPINAKFRNSQVNHIFTKLVEQVCQYTKPVNIFDQLQVKIT